MVNRLSQISDQPERVVIFRRGSIGDAVVSIPALNEIARRFPNCDRRILSNTPVMEQAALAQDVLDNSGIVHGFFNMPPGGGGISRLKQTASEIRRWNPDLLIYLSEPSKFISMTKETLFFRWCGIGRIIGLPRQRALCHYIKRSDRLWESESERLLRAIGADRDRDRDWSFLFSVDEEKAALAMLSPWAGHDNFIAFSIGAKLPDKDWGDENWRKVLIGLTAKHPELGIVVLGAAQEFARSEDILKNWNGPKLNLCGKSAPRIGALLCRDAKFYLGHDSGPMHLAALVETPCIAVFSARAKPGVWFPKGEKNRIFYPWTQVDKVSNRAGFRTAGASIFETDANDVVDACLDLIVDNI